MFQFYQDTLETNDDEKGDDGVKENEKKTDKSASVLKGKSEEEDQNCKCSCYFFQKIKNHIHYIGKLLKYLNV